LTRTRAAAPPRRRAAEKEEDVFRFFSRETHRLDEPLTTRFHH
jgi:hypothetical protein